MVSFESKEISNPPSFSERLKTCREEQGIKIAEAAKATNISAKYLQALEAGEFNKLPGEVYARSFLKAYTKFLGLGYEEFLPAFEREQKVYHKTRSIIHLDHKKPVERVSRLHLMVTPKIVRGLIIGLLALACLFYLGLKISRIMSPPLLQLKTPAENIVTDQNFIQVAGQVEPEATLEINGQQIFVAKSGEFSEDIDLQPGVNVIEIMAQSRHGKQTKILRQVMVNK